MRVAGRASGTSTLALELCPTARLVATVRGDKSPADRLDRSTSWAFLRKSTQLLGATRRHFRADFDLVVTAQQVRSYKPDPAHFKECARRIEGTKKNWVHIASGYPTDVDPCLKSKIPVIWVNRHGEELEPGLKKPDAEVKSFRDAGKLLNAA